MPNRAERRAAARRGRRAGGRSVDPSRMPARSREGLVDEYSLQQRSIRLQNGETGEWKPAAHFDGPQRTDGVGIDSDGLSVRDPKNLRGPHGVRGWVRFFCWLLIVLSAVAFVVVMWIPNMPTWSIILVAAIFAVGVLSLFFVAGNPKDNPNIDANGTAV